MESLLSLFNYIRLRTKNINVLGHIKAFDICAFYRPGVIIIKLIAVHLGISIKPSPDFTLWRKALTNGDFIFLHF